jgi:hypothetical protein
VNGPVKLTGGHADSEFIPHQLPVSKEEIEREICSGALKAMRFHGWTAWPLGIEPRQNELDDFDFSFELGSGREYLDLAEVAPLEGVRGGYEGVPTTFPRRKLTDEILRLVERKGTHYGRSRRSTVHLLLYITDFRFLVSEGVVTLSKWYLRSNHFGFKSICYYAPIDSEAGWLRVLYPAPDGVPYLSKAQVRELREGTVTNFDPRKWRYDSERGGFFAEMPSSE